MYIVLNGIVKKPLEYLINILSNNKNITVFITQQFGTFSDYIIYHPKYDIYDPEPEFDKRYKYLEYFTKDKYEEITDF